MSVDLCLAPLPLRIELYFKKPLKTFHFILIFNLSKRMNGQNSERFAAGDRQLSAGGEGRDMGGAG